VQVAELPFHCPKCDHSEYETGQMRATGGFWSKIFDVQGRHFTTLTCARCRYTEMYQAESSTLGSVFDFFTN
jgi:predicted nucleic-acid-binding Zn-ribbon protein